MGVFQTGFEFNCVSLFALPRTSIIAISLLKSIINDHISEVLLNLTAMEL